MTDVKMIASQYAPMKIILSPQQKTKEELLWMYNCNTFCRESGKMLCILGFWDPPRLFQYYDGREGGLYYNITYSGRGGGFPNSLQYYIGGGKGGSLSGP